MSEDQIPHQISKCEKHYLQLHMECTTIITTSFQVDADGAQAKSHNYIPDFEKWIGVLSGRNEVHLLKAALREYQFALLALVQGQYRQAFMSLRLFLELALAAIQLSANELELRKWLNGCRDIHWTSLIDAENGVYSKSFVKAFYVELAEEAPHYRVIAERVYRECSEYVHGNAHTHHTLPETLRFMEDAFYSWHEKAASIRLVVSFALCVRYLFDLQESTRNELEGVVLDELQHITAIRALYGGVTEVN